MNQLITQSIHNYRALSASDVAKQYRCAPSTSLHLPSLARSLTKKQNLPDEFPILAYPPSKTIPPPPPQSRRRRASPSLPLPRVPHTHKHSHSQIPQLLSLTYSPRTLFSHTTRRTGKTAVYVLDAAQDNARSAKKLCES